LDVVPTLDQIIERSDILPFEFAEGAAGIMYTCNGGFIDFGHLLDQIELTHYYHHYLTKGGANTETSTIPIYGFDKGTVTFKQKVPEADRATTAASIVFDESVFYELFSYWILSPGMHNSGFSPEDLVSNYIGVRVAERALQSTNKRFERAVDDELAAVLDLLEPRTKAQTQAAFDAINGTWVESTTSRLVFFDDDFLFRRNFNFSPISPCFVTAAGTGCSGTPAFPSSIPSSFPPTITDRYEAEFKVKNDDAKAKLGATVKRSEFANKLTAILTDAEGRPHGPGSFQCPP
jgi:hypothetical protein